MDTILWSELGAPTEPGNVRVEGLGNVEVTQRNIDDVAEVGGNPQFDLHDATSIADTTHRYLLGLMR